MDEFKRALLGIRDVLRGSAKTAAGLWPNGQTDRTGVHVTASGGVAVHPHERNSAPRREAREPAAVDVVLGVRRSEAM